MKIMKDFILDCFIKILEVAWYVIFAAFMIVIVIPLAIILMIFGCVCETVNFAGKKLCQIIRWCLG